VAAVLKKQRVATDEAAVLGHHHHVADLDRPGAGTEVENVPWRAAVMGDELSFLPCTDSAATTIAIFPLPDGGAEWHFETALEQGLHFFQRKRTGIAIHRLAGIERAAAQIQQRVAQPRAGEIVGQHQQLPVQGLKCDNWQIQQRTQRLLLRMQPLREQHQSGGHLAPEFALALDAESATLGKAQEIAQQWPRFRTNDAVVQQKLVGNQQLPALGKPVIGQRQQQERVVVLRRLLKQKNVEARRRQELLQTLQHTLRLLLRQGAGGAPFFLEFGESRHLIALHCQVPCQCAGAAADLQHPGRRRQHQRQQLVLGAPLRCRIGHERIDLLIVDTKVQPLGRLAGGQRQGLGVDVQRKGQMAGVHGQGSNALLRNRLHYTPALRRGETTMFLLHFVASSRGRTWGRMPA
jgi:hypothetical protein